MLNRSSSLLLLILLFCFSKELFLYDEELIVISCLFLVFIILNELLGDIMKSFFESQTKGLHDYYFSRFDIEESNIYHVLGRLENVFLANLDGGLFLLKFKNDMLYFYSYNFFLQRVFFILLLKEFLKTFLTYEFLLERTLYLKNFGIIVNKSKNLLCDVKNVSNNKQSSSLKKKSGIFSRIHSFFSLNISK